MFAFANRVFPRNTLSQRRQLWTTAVIILLRYPTVKRSWPPSFRTPQHRVLELAPNHDFQRITGHRPGYLASVGSDWGMSFTATRRRNFQRPSSRIS